MTYAYSIMQIISFVFRSHKTLTRATDNGVLHAGRPVRTVFRFTLVAARSLTLRRTWQCQSVFVSSSGLILSRTEHLTRMVPRTPVRRAWLSASRLAAHEVTRLDLLKYTLQSQQRALPCLVIHDCCTSNIVALSTFDIYYAAN